MNSSTAKHARNRIVFVTEKNAGTGPSLGREVHTSPQDLSGQATGATPTAGGGSISHHPRVWAAEGTLRR